MWALIIVSSFAVVFIVWMAMVIRRSPRRQPSQITSRDPAKNDAEVDAILMMLPMIAISSG
jgi:hypothetical protein